jgi:hypothetical protein
MNQKLCPLIEEINDNMLTDGKSDKFIYRAKLLEILDKYLVLRKKLQHP